MSEPDAIICSHCEDGKEPIKEVCFTEVDGLYQFMCGREDHTVAEAWPIHSSHVFEENAGLKFLLALQRNFLAERTSCPDGWKISFVDIDE
ncbi:MAG: hypothetical protein ABJG15_01880 [Hyphomonadaceae bacterium]